MKDKLMVGVFQSTYQKGLDLNRIQLETFVESYGPNHDLLLLPELFSSGYFMESSYLKESAIGLEGPELKKVCQMAAEYSVVVAYPFLEVLEERLFNTVAVIDKQGAILAIKRKAINWKTELGLIEEGALESAFPVVEIEGFRVGILICYEASFPETARRLAKQDCDVIIVTAFWSDEAKEHWIHQLSARALDNNVYVIGVNGVLGRHSCGHSMIVQPDGEIIDHLDKKAGVLTGVLEKDVLKEARKKYPYYKDYLKYFSNMSIE